METQIKKHYITEIVKYLERQGLTVDSKELESLLSSNDYQNLVS